MSGGGQPPVSLPPRLFVVGPLSPRQLLGVQPDTVFAFCNRGDASIVRDRIVQLGPDEWRVWSSRVNPDYFLLTRLSKPDRTGGRSAAAASTCSSHISVYEQELQVLANDVLSAGLSIRLVEHVHQDVEGLLRLHTSWGIEADSDLTQAKQQHLDRLFEM